MRLHRFHHPAPLTEDSDCVLSEQARLHACRVLRLKPGGFIQLFDGNGKTAQAEIVVCEKRNLTARIIKMLTDTSKASIHIHLYQAISRGQKMDYTLQKAAELGVRQITPIHSQRSNYRIRPSKMDHWRGVLISACEQSGCNTIPTLNDPIELRELSNQTMSGSRIILTPNNGQGLATLKSENNQYHLLCGPEGGFSAEEEASASAVGFKACRLGPRILRTETAAIVASSALHTLYGDFR